MVRAGTLSTLRRGAYVRGAPPERAEHLHLLLVRAALEHLSEAAVVSHVSAAVLHGLPVWGLPLDRVHVTRPGRRSGGRRGQRVHVHTAGLDRDECETVGGVRVTSVERVLVDLARTIPFEQAVVVADAALFRRLVNPDGLARAVQRHPRWPGVPAAGRALRFADGRSESVGESRSRVAISLAGLPAPVLQWEVRSTSGRLIGRVDFGWPDLATIGEFDGRVKYGRLLRPDRSPGDVVYEEKRREDELRAVGLGVVRWGWSDLSDFGVVADRLAQRFRRA